LEKTAVANYIDKKLFLLQNKHSLSIIMKLRWRSLSLAITTQSSWHPRTVGF